jgi:hypothetical protein
MTTRYVTRGGRQFAVETLETNAKPTPRKRTESFAKVPLGWAAKAAKATGTPRALVWVQLVHLAWRAKGQTQPVPKRGAGEVRSEPRGEARSPGGIGGG